MSISENKALIRESNKNRHNISLRDLEDHYKSVFDSEEFVIFQYVNEGGINLRLFWQKDGLYYNNVTSLIDDDKTKYNKTAEFVDNKIYVFLGNCFVAHVVEKFQVHMMRSM